MKYDTNDNHGRYDSSPTIYSSEAEYVAAMEAGRVHDREESMMRNLWSSKEARDAEWIARGRQGRRYSVRNQQLHPMYVEDLKDTPEGRDRGFGNTAYQTFHKVLYGIR